MPSGSGQPGGAVRAGGGWNSLGRLKGPPVVTRRRSLVRTLFKPVLVCLAQTVGKKAPKGGDFGVAFGRALPPSPTLSGLAVSSTSAISSFSAALVALKVWTAGL